MLRRVVDSTWPQEHSKDHQGHVSIIATHRSLTISNINPAVPVLAKICDMVINAFDLKAEHDPVICFCVADHLVVDCNIRALSLDLH